MESGKARAEDTKGGKGEGKEEEKKGGKGGDVAIPGLQLQREGEQSRWTEYRFSSKLPERRSYMCSCVYKSR